MSASLISELITLANTSNMNNKHAAAISYGKRILAAAPNYFLWGTNDRSSMSKSWEKLQTYVRCNTECGPPELYQKYQFQ